MAVAVLLEFQNMTPEQYDAVVGDMNLNGVPANRQILHVAGPKGNGGWRVVDVWESEEDFQAFARAQIVPLAATHEVTEEPRLQVWPVHNLLR